MNEPEKSQLAKELLVFLSSCPKQLRENGVAYAPKLAVSIGNALRSLSFELERGQPQIFQPFDEPAQSVYALAMQFREVGVYLWDKKPSENWVSEIDCLKKRVAFLELKICNGGAK